MMGRDLVLNPDPGMKFRAFNSKTLSNLKQANTGDKWVTVREKPKKKDLFYFWKRSYFAIKNFPAFRAGDFRSFRWQISSKIQSILSSQKKPGKDHLLKK